MAKRANTVANYRDPAPNRDLMGWGERQLRDAQKRVMEQKMQEALPNVIVAGDAIGAGTMLPTIEKKIRSLFMFDEGWSCLVAEQLVYELADAITLMIAQNIGNCVGASHAGLIASRYAHEILALGDAEERLGVGNLAMPFIPYTYGVGRWVGNMLRGGDGSYCGAQIEGTMKYGFLPCFTPGLDQFDGTLPQCSASVGRQFGKSKSLLQEWSAKAVQFDLLEAPRCTSADDAKELIAGKQIPLQICSGQGFVYDRFDEKYGVHLYRPGGRWSHSMQLVACFAIKGQWFIVIRNQWGMNAHKGSPEIGVPGGCMVITLETFAKWIRSAECIGIGSIKGLEANPGA